MVLDTAASFRPLTAGNWQWAGGLAGNPRVDRTLAPQPGAGVLICTPRPGAKEHLFTADSFGDADIEMEFLLAPGANSGLYLQGRYEVQLFDSWKVPAPTAADCGGIYLRWDAQRGPGQEGFEGRAPRANACRAPGLWQTLRVEFEAPRFDAAGQKVRAARFVKVTLNGFVIHENVEVSGPTRSAAFNDEQATGPLMIQGDHGAVAVRHLRITPRARPEMAAVGNGASPKPQPKPPTRLAIEPVDGRVRVQRGFVPYAPSKRLYAISVGTPAGIHYSYDFDTAALLRVWRGAWLDVAEMWDNRGNNQWAVPLGPDLVLNARPTVAVLEFPERGTWPETVDALWSSQGYVLEASGQPVFLSTLGPLKIRDRIAPRSDGGGLDRSLQFAGRVFFWPTVVLLAQAPVITPQPDGAGWVVGDRGWYLDWPANSPYQPVVQGRPGQQQLVVKLSDAHLATPVSYSLIW